MGPRGCQHLRQQVKERRTARSGEGQAAQFVGDYDVQIPELVREPFGVGFRQPLPLRHDERVGDQ